VVLFDEIEKAHPDIWNTLLQALDDGRLTDGQGRTVDFKNTVIILTSNVGSAAAAAIEEDTSLSERERLAKVKSVVLSEVRQSFRPEFLNRLDELIVFHRLGKDEMQRIVDIQLGRFVKRVQGRGIKIEVTPAAKEFLIEQGWDPVYGARPLKRAILRFVEDELARKLLGSEFVSGDSIRVDRGDGALTFQKNPG
jgi:ATP-dependent Clp protease ATP-binding subunit ClpB